VWQNLSSSLGGNKLYAVLPNSGGMQLFQDQCESKDSNAFDIASSGHGICIQNFACHFQFCDLDGSQIDYLPEYTVDVRSESDIQEVLRFANEYDIPLSIKTSGHSYTASSTSSGSILFWMANFPRDGNVTVGFKDSYGTKSNVVGIGGRTTWNYVIEAVNDKYHIVMGSSRTVAAAGG
jgi:hypothetical protein